MSLCVLPDCKTVLHAIARNYEFLEYFIKFTRGGEDPFVVPFIENMNGDTALHTSMAKETGNSRSTEYFLRELLPGMPFDHHGRAISDLIPKLVKQELPFIGDYLDSRFFQTD